MNIEIITCKLIGKIKPMRKKYIVSKKDKTNSNTKFLSKYIPKVNFEDIRS